MHTRLNLFHSSLTLLAACALSALATGQIQLPGGRERDCPELLPPADPTVDVEYGCYYFGNYTWNDGSGSGDVSGRIYWPSDCSSSTPPGVHPLVLLMHGDGHNYTDYGYLMSHLARNGFIAATIESTGTNLQRTGQALTYLNFIRNTWTHKTHVANSIGLIGHSRGGESVLTTARRIVELGLTHDIDSIISLAPTDNDEGGAGTHESLDGGESENYLVIYGTHDNDVIGPCIGGTAPNCGVPPAGPRRTGFGLFDRAGVESETEPFPLYDEVVTRAFVFVEGANHNGFRSTCGGFPPAGQLSCAEHQDVARGYMNAFLRWTLRGQTIYRDYFTGRWMPEAVELADVKVRNQYVQGYGRRVIDDFTDAAFNSNSLGGAVTMGGVLQLEHHGELWQYVETAPHDTRAAVVSWTPPGFAPWIRWSIPNTMTSMGARHRDVRGFDFLSVRAGQVYGSPFNDADNAKDFWVALTDSGNHVSNWLRASSVTELGYPITANVLTPLLQTATTVSSSMQTVRLPICKFYNVDLANITAVTIYFTVPGSSSGEIMLDNLEFTD